MLLLALLLQTSVPPPDISLGVRVRARSVEIQRKGNAQLKVVAKPDGGSSVATRVEPRGSGRTKLRNVAVDIRGEARLARPATPERGTETRQPE